MKRTAQAGLLDEAFTALQKGDTTVALVHLEKLATEESSPAVLSGLGYCLARERHQYKKGLDLCSRALDLDPNNPSHYLYLGRIYLLANHPAQAIRIFRRGIKFGLVQEFRKELERLGVRKTPVVAVLSRAHPLNKYLGLVMKKLKLR